MSKFITFFGQKGGCGKSTMTTLCANYLAYSQIKKVVVLDADADQFSLFNKRRFEYEGLSETLKAKRPVEKCFPIHKCCIGSSNYNDVISLSKLMLDDSYYSRLDSDYVFIDFAGSLNYKDSSDFLEILCKMDYIFVPIEPSDFSLLSQVQTIGTLKASVKELHPDTKVVTFLNKMPFSMSAKQFEAFENFYNRVEPDVKMQNSIYNSNAFLYKDLVNTIFPIKHRFLNGEQSEGYQNEFGIGSFIDEFYSIILK